MSPVSYLVLVQPANDFITFVHDLLLVLVADLAGELLVLHGGLHVEGVRLQGVLGGDLVPLDIIFVLVLLSLLHHALDVLLAEATCDKSDRVSIRDRPIWIFFLGQIPIFFQP